MTSLNMPVVTTDEMHTHYHELLKTLWPMATPRELAQMGSFDHLRRLVQSGTLSASLQAQLGTYLEQLPGYPESLEHAAAHHAFLHFYVFQLTRQKS